MADRVLLVLAETADGAPGHGRPVAGALNLIGSHALFGRNWGCIYGDRVPNLHFEVGHAGHAGHAGQAEATRLSCVLGGGNPALEGREAGRARGGAVALACMTASCSQCCVLPSLKHADCSQKQIILCPTRPPAAPPPLPSRVPQLCYYQALEFAIERGLQRVEAGAQGEHKLQRVGCAGWPTGRMASPG